MKIWVIGRNYPDKRNNRQGSFELEQAKMLAKRGNDVTYIACVLHPFWRIKDGGYIDFAEGPLQICAYSGFFTPHMTDPLVQSPYFPKIRNKRWRTLLKRAEEAHGLPEVIHIHFPLMVLAAEVFKEFHDRGVKIIVTEHWTKVLNKRLDKYEKSQMRSYLQFADEYMAVGYLLKHAIIESSGTEREIIVMPNIINDVFKADRRSHDRFLFGVVSRLSPEKQIDKIIEVFARQFKGQADIRLVIVGGGSERKRLGKLSDKYGLKEQIEFKGSLSRDDTAEIVKKLDCLICFSRFETFGVPVIEAWACGVPVITTTAQSLSDKWDKKMGVSISHTDVNALGVNMVQMVRDKDQYDHRYISEHALSIYSEDCIYCRLMDIYRG